MPTKRRALKHSPRIGQVRVTQRLLDVYRAYQQVLRTDRNSVRSADLQHALHHALRHLPWENQDQQERDYAALHKLAYADPRPARLDCFGRPVDHDDLDEHDEERRSG